MVSSAFQHPTTETIEHPAAVSIPCSGLASDGGSKYSETVSFPASQEDNDYDDDETLSSATGRDRDSPTEVCLNIIPFTFSFLSGIWSLTCTLK